MAREKPIPIKFSARTLWYIDALVQRGRYGENRTDVIRRFVLDGIGRAQDAGHVHKPEPSASGMPPVKAPEDEPR